MKFRGRTVWPTLGLYLAGGWLVLQVIDVLVDNTGLPQRVFGYALALLALGLPIALITAIVQGSVRGDEAPGRTAFPHDVDAGGAVRKIFTWRNLGLGALLGWFRHRCSRSGRRKATRTLSSQPGFQ